MFMKGGGHVKIRKHLSLDAVHHIFFPDLFPSIHHRQVARPHSIHPARFYKSSFRMDVVGVDL
jgi:hypothetical protein